MAWSYSDWLTESYGSTRLSKLRSHIQEVSDALSAELTAGAQSRSTHAVQRYLDTLLAKLPREERLCDQAAGTRPLFTRGRALLG